QELLGRINLLDEQVAALPVKPEKAEEIQNAEGLRRKRDAAQTDFVRFQADLATKYGVAAGAVYDLARVQAQLREDAALLAWLDLDEQAKPADPKGDHWACLVRHRGAPIWIRLPGTGPSGAWTEEDDRLAVQARRALANRPTDAAGAWKDV